MNVIVKKATATTITKAISERVTAKWFCCAFKLGFFQLVYQASLLFKSNLKLALTKTKRNYMSQSMFPWSVDI